MMKISKKKTTEQVQQKASRKVGALRIRNNNINNLVEELLRRDKFDTDLGIEDSTDFIEHSNGN